MIRSLLSILAAALLVGDCTGENAARDTARANGAVTTANAALGDTALSTASRDGARTQPGTTNAAGTTRGMSPVVPANGQPATTPATTRAAQTPGTTSVATPAQPVPSGNALAGTGTAPAATTTAPTPAPAAAPARPAREPLPFSPGEQLSYDVKFGSIDVGNAVMDVVGVEEVRGRPAFHVRFNVKGGTLFYKVNDHYESWIDTTSLVSLRHVQDIDEGRYERERHYEIMPERGVYRENDKPEQETVAQPLDDGSFFFFLRTIPLEVGQTYSFNRYFKPDRNPVTVTVVRKERIKVPAGTFDAIVLHPTIKAKGVFGEGGQAEIWLADDSSRVMLQMKSKLKIGSLNLYLKKIKRGS